MHLHTLSLLQNEDVMAAVVLSGAVSEEKHEVVFIFGVGLGEHIHHKRLQNEPQFLDSRAEGACSIRGMLRVCSIYCGAELFASLRRLTMLCMICPKTSRKSTIKQRNKARKQRKAMQGKCQE